jgi:hypothetical protein
MIGCGRSRGCHILIRSSRAGLCAVEGRIHALFLVESVTGTAFRRFDAFTRDDWNHENCGY